MSVKTELIVLRKAPFKMDMSYITGIITFKAPKQIQWM